MYQNLKGKKRCLSQLLVASHWSTVYVTYLKLSFETKLISNSCHFIFSALRKCHEAVWSLFAFRSQASVCSRDWGHVRGAVSCTCFRCASSDLPPWNELVLSFSFELLHVSLWPFLCHIPLGLWLLELISLDFISRGSLNFWRTRFVFFF